MKKTFILPLTLVVAVAILSGCATQKTRTGKKTSVLGGFVTVEKNEFQPVPITSAFVINTNETFGNAGKVSGTQVKIAWGSITLNDY
jgi:predicted small secreted protein